METIELEQIKRELGKISPWPWKCSKSVPGEWWVTAPDQSDHECRLDYEPIFESSGTIPQFGIDGDFIAKAPERIAELIRLLEQKE